MELLKENPAWDTEARREDMNHFMARLIFCFFAEDTGIFIGNGLFTDTVAQMSAKDSSNTDEVISTIFAAMNTRNEARRTANLPRWVDAFPYVNGGLFSGSTEVPRFSKIARSYLLNVGALEWKKINPDIFGSMIQAVADDEERGALGMHYTSVPNILKVLNPLFLDDLREKLAEAGDNPRKLLNYATAWRGSGSSTQPAAQATSSSSPIGKCGRSRRRSTGGAANLRGRPISPRQTSGVSSCAASRPRSPVGADHRGVPGRRAIPWAEDGCWRSSCRWTRRIGSHAAMPCGSIGSAFARLPEWA